MAAETGFLIDGKLYEVPALDSLNTDEALVLYELSGITQEDFVPEAGETEDETRERSVKLIRHPGFWTSLMMIAYQRANPALKPAQVKQMIGKTNRLEALATVAPDEEETETVPLVLTSEPNEQSSSGLLDSETSTPDSTATGGNGSTNGSAAQDNSQPATTHSRSDTSSISAREISAA